MSYMLDFDTFCRESFLSNGAIPDVNIIRMFELIVELANTAYQQGRVGEPFDIGHGIPVKQIEL